MSSELDIMKAEVKGVSVRPLEIEDLKNVLLERFSFNKESCQIEKPSEYSILRSVIWDLAQRKESLSEREINFIIEKSLAIPLDQIQNIVITKLKKQLKIKSELETTLLSGLTALLCYQRNYEESLKYALKLLKQDYVHSVYFYNVSVLYKELNDLKKSNKYLFKAIQIDPKLSFYWILWCENLVALNQFDDAQKMIQKLSSRDGWEQHEVLRIANILLLLKMEEEAVVFLKKHLVVLKKK